MKAATITILVLSSMLVLATIILHLTVTALTGTLLEQDVLHAAMGMGVGATILLMETVVPPAQLTEPIAGVMFVHEMYKLCLFQPPLCGEDFAVV